MKKKQYSSYQNSKKILVKNNSKSKIFHLKSNNRITKTNQQNKSISKEALVSKSVNKGNVKKIITPKTAKNSYHQLIMNKNSLIPNSIKRQNIMINQKNQGNSSSSNKYNKSNRSSKIKLLKKMNINHKLNTFNPKIKSTKNEILVNLLNIKKCIKKQNSFQKFNKKSKIISTRNKELHQIFTFASKNSFKLTDTVKKCTKGNDKKNNQTEKNSKLNSLNNDNNILKTEISCNSMEIVSDSKLEINSNNSNFGNLNKMQENLNNSKLKNEKIEKKESGKNFAFSNKNHKEIFFNFINQYNKNNNNENKNNDRINKYKNVFLNKTYKDKKTNNNICKLEIINKSHNIENSSSSSSCQLISFNNNNNDSKSNKNYFDDTEIILKCLKGGTNLSEKRYITLRKKLSKKNRGRNKSFKNNFKSYSKISNTTKSSLNNKNNNFGNKILRFNNSYGKSFKIDNKNKKNKIPIKDYLSFNKINSKNLKLENSRLNSDRNTNKTQKTKNKNISKNKKIGKLIIGNLKLNSIRNNNYNICNTTKNINVNKKKFLFK